MAYHQQDSNHYVKLRAVEFFTNFIRNHDNEVGESAAFNLLEPFWPHDELVRQIRGLFTEEQMKNIRETARRRFRLDLYDDVDNILQSLWNHEASRDRFQNVFFQKLEEIRNDLSRRVQKHDAFKKRLELLRGALKLSDFETDILLVLHCLHIHLIITPEGHWRSHSNERNKIDFIAKCLDCHTHEVTRALAAKGKLRRYNCVDADVDYCDGHIEAFLCGLEEEAFTSAYFKKDTQKTLPLDFYGDLAERHGAILKDIIRKGRGERPVNILLYGAPGTGKTSFSKTLAAELGLDCYCVAQKEATESHGGRAVSDSAFRFGALHICYSQVDPARSVIVVDEADDMLGGRGGGLAAFFGGDACSSAADKALLNDVLDTVKTPIIWITNTSSRALDPSSRRRFDYSIRFDALSRRQRLMIWQNSVKQMKLRRLFSDTVLEELASQYAVSAGGISLVLQNIARLKPKKSEVADYIKTLMTPHCELMGIPPAPQMLLPAKDYSLEGLNIKGKVPLERIVEAARRFQSNTGPQSPDQPRMNMLLSGAPGTGKTEFVKYLGKTLDTKIVVKMGSDLLSMWVGGTEQNIKNAFREAAADKAILFLDEIDGLLQSRAGAQRSWEVTQVNELLHQMENFDGIFIGATNFSANLDAASQRRFTFKLEFDFLDNAGKRIFFERMFRQRLTAADAATLDGIPNLAPGDFRTARQSLYYLGGEATTADYLAALSHESRSKDNSPFSTKEKIGF